MSLAPQRVLVWVAKHSLTENLLRLALAVEGIETVFSNAETLSPEEMQGYAVLLIDDAMIPSVEKWSLKLAKAKKLPRLIYLAKAAKPAGTRKPGLISWTCLAKPFNPQELRDMILNT